MIQEEIWREIEGFPDYHISNLGRVVHIERPGVIRKTSINHKGFPTLVLFHKNHTGARYLRQVNKLVASAFLGQAPPRLDSVWHIDGDLLNCQADNLKWDMRSRVMEWNEMHRTPGPKFRTGRVMINATGRVFENAYEVALHVSEIESAVVAHIERYPDQHVDRARYKYV